jgi:hypothetical protein
MTTICCTSTTRSGCRRGLQAEPGVSREEGRLPRRQVRRASCRTTTGSTSTTCTELAGMDFVFLALTDGAAKKVIVDALGQYNVSFTDCDMGCTRWTTRWPAKFASSPARPATGRKRAGTLP